MASGKIVLFCNGTLEQAVAFGEASCGVVLLVEVGSSKPQPDPAVWVHRFKSLSSTMLRNYLKGSDCSMGYLGLIEVPSPPTASELFKLLAAAYEWVVVIAPQALSTKDKPLLVVADAVFRLKKNGEDSRAHELF